MLTAVDDVDSRGAELEEGASLSSNLYVCEEQNVTCGWQRRETFSSASHLSPYLWVAAKPEEITVTQSQPVFDPMVIDKGACQIARIIVPLKIWLRNGKGYPARNGKEYPAGIQVSRRTGGQDPFYKSLQLTEARVEVVKEVAAMSLREADPGVLSVAVSGRKQHSASCCICANQRLA